jgi:hypothetical protein
MIPDLTDNKKPPVRQGGFSKLLKVLDAQLFAAFEAASFENKTSGL